MTAFYSSGGLLDVFSMDATFTKFFIRVSKHKQPEHAATNTATGTHMLGELNVPRQPVLMLVTSCNRLSGLVASRVLTRNFHGVDGKRY